MWKLVSLQILIWAIVAPSMAETGTKTKNWVLSWENWDNNTEKIGVIFSHEVRITPPFAENFDKFQKSFWMIWNMNC